MKSKKKISKKGLKSAVSSSEAIITLDVKVHGLEPVLGAAYLMMDKAFVSLSGDRAKTITVALRAKDPKAVKPRALADEFLADLESQKVRWAIAKNNLPIREFIAEQAVLIANGTVTVAPPAPAPEPAAEQLTDEQRAEIEKLISEVEAEIKTMNEKKVAQDPKGVKASWEETHAQERKAS